MALRRSRPMLIAPAIPLWAVIAFFGVERFAGTKRLVPFVAVMCILFVALFAYIAKQALRARRSRTRR